MGKLDAHEGTVNCLSLFQATTDYHNLTFLFSGSSDKTIIQWNIDKSIPIRTYEGGHDSDVWCIVTDNNQTCNLQGEEDHSNQGWKMFSGGFDKRICHWDIWVRTDGSIYLSLSN